ncbi:MAG TPA: potassium transporter Kef [Polyangiales bacterium]|nr:potassium transporter Kef [Polyangiales bacterium]
MSEMALLLALLVVSYVGSLLLSSGGRGYGMPAGSHWLVLGFVFGPYALKLAPHDAIASFGPLALVATAWIALVLGAEYGYAGERGLSPRAILLGFATALSSAGLVALPVYAIAFFVAKLSAHDARIVAAGLGLSCCESARQAVRWVAERGAEGPLLRLLEDITDTDEIVPLLGLAFLFAGVPSSLTVVPISYPVWLLVTLLLGIVLGLTATLLLSGLTNAAESWGVLLGAALLGTGIAWRLSISPLTALFVMGVCVSALSRHALALRPMLARTEAAVLLPTLLLAGALLRFDGKGLWWILPATLIVRTLARGALGYTLALATGARADQRFSIGLGMSSTGAVSVLVGLTFAFRFPGALGDLVLTVASCCAVVGDVLGPFGLRRALVPSEAHALLPSEDENASAS